MSKKAFYDEDRIRPRLNVTVAKDTRLYLHEQANAFGTSMGEQVDQAVKLLRAVRMAAAREAAEAQQKLMEVESKREAEAECVPSFKAKVKKEKSHKKFTKGKPMRRRKL